MAFLLHLLVQKWGTGLIQSDLIETLIGGLYYVRLALDVNRPENV